MKASKSYGLYTPPNYLLRPTGLEDIYGVISEKAGREAVGGRGRYPVYSCRGPPTGLGSIESHPPTSCRPRVTRTVRSLPLSSPQSSRPQP